LNRICYFYSKTLYIFIFLITVSEPLVLHRNDIEQHICPVRAYLRWLSFRGPMPGFIFLQVDKYKRISDGTVNYVSFLSYLRSDLKKIGIAKWYLYGTHSFRRGGAQYYMNVQGKSMEQIRAWGGWRDRALFDYLKDQHSLGVYARHNFTRPLK
jgi:hypothetical protein